TLFDYVPGTIVTFDHLAEDARRRREEQIVDHYEARKLALEQASFGTPPYKPVPHELLFLEGAAWPEAVAGSKIRYLSPFDSLDGAEGVSALNFRARIGRNFALERAEQADRLFDAVIAHIGALQSAGKRVMVAAWTAGARERLGHMLQGHGLKASQ